MKTETEQWTFGGMVAVAAMAGLALWIGVFAVLGSCGCAAVGPIIDAAGPALTNAIPEPGVGEPPTVLTNSPIAPEVTEALKAADIASCHQGAGDEWLRWPATHPLKATIKGNRLHLESTAFKAWPSKDDIVGAMWFVVLRDGKWQAYCWDYTRARNDPREVPWRDAKKPVSWMTVIPGERWYVCMTGLYRDKRRTVSERTVIAEVVQ